ncbi:MAG: histidine triad nucleotide-binding protein [Planctomycetota bacterium]|jgi:histidine triad (HIT) family protein|nr:histidine triad nucleotide-binding protein [Planctomycetota bacterium]
MSNKTIFKQIIDREIPAEVVYEDDLCLAFYDVAPQAPVHVLVIPKKEVKSVNDLVDEDLQLAGHLLLTIKKVAQQLGLSDGYRVISNCGAKAGQTVDHLHFHILAGRDLNWPPG